MFTQPSPLDEAIEILREVQLTIARVRDVAGSLPAAYHGVIAAELRAVAESLSEHPDTQSHHSGKAAAGGSRPTANGTSARRPKPANEGANVRERIKQFFRDRGNEAAAVHEIESGTGAGQSAVTTLLYRRNNGEFERAGTRKSGAAPLVLWRLSAEEWEKVRHPRAEGNPS